MLIIYVLIFLLYNNPKQQVFGIPVNA